MARIVKPLTNTEIERAKPRDKEFSLADGGGLFLRVMPSGSRIWLFNYLHPFTKKRSNLTLGKFPDLSLAQARAKREEYRVLLAQQIDPQTHRVQQQQAQANQQFRTFEKMAQQWIEDRKTKANFSELTAKDVWAMLERHALPHFGNYPLEALTPLLVINALKPLEATGKLTTLHKVTAKINEVMRFALHRGLIASNPLSEIYKEFDRPPESAGMATIAPEDLAHFLSQLLAAREAGKFSAHSFYAVLFTLLTGSRPSEIAGAKWEDINLAQSLWSYRVQKGNKNLPEGRLHTVTLSRQALNLLQQMRTLNAMLGVSASPYVFPSITAKRGHITIEAIRQAIIKSVGEVGVLTTHGIRHLLSTSLNERNYNDDWIEKSLSHKIKNKVRRAYNKAEYLEQRFAMFQAWADHIESLAPNLFSTL